MVTMSIYRPRVSSPPAPGMGIRERVMALVAAALIAVALFLPLWGMVLVSPQYGDGLQLNVYASHFAGSGSDYIDDLAEINTLNHYIGMAEIHAADFPELKVLPIGLGLAAVLAAAAGLFARKALVVGSLAVMGVIGAGGLASAYGRLYQYGHNLDPTAPVKVDPFTPVLLGSNQLANFVTTGAFQSGALVLAIAGALLAGGLWMAWRRAH